MALQSGLLVRYRVFVAWFLASLIAGFCVFLPSALERTDPFSAFLTTLLLSPVILIFTLPTLIVRLAVRFRWGIWAFAAVGGVIGAIYLPVIELVGDYLFSSEGEQVRFKAWAWYVRHLPSYIFSGVLAGAVWWWIEKRLNR